MTIAVTMDPVAVERLRTRAGELLALDRRPRERLLELQRERLRALIEHAVAHSPYYRDALGPDAPDTPLEELPTLSKARLLEHFDEVVTDPTLRLAHLERFLADAAPGAAYRGEYRVFATSGSTGMPGIFVYTLAEFAEWVAVALALLARHGATPATRVATIGAPSDVHVTRQLFAGIASGREGAPRLDVTLPVPELVDQLNRYRPEAFLTYASIGGELAEEQLRGRLAIDPRIVAVGSEVLTDETEQRIEEAWGIRPVNVYAATEAPSIAVGHPGSLRVVEHSVVVEVVDTEGRPVPPGVPGSKVLLTSLVGRAQPLIRYELSDCVVLADGPDPDGLPYLRLARVDGRSDDILSLPTAGGGRVAVHPHRLRSPFVTLLDVRQYQIVHTRDGALRVLLVPRPGAAGVVDRIREAIAGVLDEAGAAPVAVRVELVDEIEREPGPAGKVKIVRSEAVQA